MKKKFLTVLLAFVAALCLCFGLAACDSGNDGDSGNGGNGSAVGGTQTEQGGGEHEHSYSNLWTSDENDHWHAATCGHTDIKDKAAHTYQNGVCSTCDHVHVNHTFGNWTEKEKPTCTVDGYQEHTCSVCGKIEQQTLTHTGHSYKNGVCSVCGSVEGLIAFRTLEVSDDDTVYGKVSNQTETFSFIQEILFADDVTFTVSYDLDGTNTIPTKTVSLEIGDNTYYVLASRGNLLKLYTVTVRRRPVYNVSFETSGSAVEPQQVEEDSEITPPAATTKRGYTFQKWTLGGTEATFPYKAEEGIQQTSNYNVTFTAVFTVNTYHVTLNVNGGDTLTETEKTLTYDEAYSFPVPTRTGYTFLGWYEGENQLTNAAGASLSAWTYAEGKQIDAHWSANNYKLTVEKNLYGAGTVTGGGSYDYESSVTVTATTNIGYNFLGWYDEADEQLSAEENYTFPMGLEQTITAKWQVVAEMANFNFSSTPTTCTISGIRDKTVTEIVIPEYVMKIQAGAFKGCSQVKSITLPFIGESRKTSSDTYQYPFGFIFGTSRFEDASAKTQYYYGSNTDTPTSSTYYIPDSLKSVTITGGNILYDAFQNCSGLESVTIESGSIGRYAFEGCSGLTKLSIGSGVTSIGDYAFSDCSGLTGELKIPDNVTSIGSYAFYNCSGLESVTIGSGVTSIGSAAFYNCSGLTGELKIPDGVTSIGDYAFWGCSGLTGVFISDLAAWCKIDFNYYTANPLYYAHHLYLDGNEVKNLTIPAEIKVIYNYAFCGCSGLESVTIGSSVTSIGDYAFHNCSGLESVIWNAENCTTAGSSSYPIFSGCTQLKTVTFGKNVKIIPAHAFSGCSGLTSIEIPNGVTSIGDYAFYNCSGLESVIWNAENCTTAGSSSYPIFSGCTQLKTVTFGESVKIIPAYAFYNCNGLTGELKIPNGVTSIGSSAFQYCSGLESIEIPDSVTSIGSYAFFYCSVKAVYYKGTPSAWGGISIGGSNGSLTNATRYYFSAQAPSAEQWEESENWWHYEADGETIVLWTKEQA